MEELMNAALFFKNSVVRTGSSPDPTLRKDFRCQTENGNRNEKDRIEVRFVNNSPFFTLEQAFQFVQGISPVMMIYDIMMASQNVIGWHRNTQHSTGTADGNRCFFLAGASTRLDARRDGLVAPWAGRGRPKRVCRHHNRLSKQCRSTARLGI